MSNTERKARQYMRKAERGYTKIREALKAAGVTFRFGWDDYDNSIELYDVPPDYRLPEHIQEIIHGGASTAYVNHTDKWETHYHWDCSVKFKPSNGWRVSYPHKRGDDEKSIFVEEVVPSWPKDWFDTGYAVVVKGQTKGS